MKQKILGIIPARSGSKGIKDKNIFPLKGKPLIFYTIKEALRSRFLDRVIVSTDSKKYAAIAKTYKAEVPFLRPKGLAEDFSSPMEAIFHALDFFKKKERYIPDIIVWLQPTAPLRKAFHIDEAIKKLLSSR
ncbi:MAG: acylneuraminate cytidylyltransferase family protein, partial [Spirochaetes bacterium]|nr:acylneuraminate cytidylyltransferase family protein [Spirochaetota bacterium]